MSKFKIMAITIIVSGAVFIASSVYAALRISPTQDQQPEQPITTSYTNGMYYESHVPEGEGVLRDPATVIPVATVHLVKKTTDTTTLTVDERLDAIEARLDRLEANQQ